MNSKIFLLSVGLIAPAAMFAATLFKADFSQAHNGIYAPGPKAIPSVSPYGRYRGNDAVPTHGKIAPKAALGRTGKWNAMRFGTTMDYFTIPNVGLENGKKFTIEMWIYVYSDQQNLSGFILDAGFGYATGFRLCPIRAGWAKDGLIQLITGDGKTSKGLSAWNGSVNAWHHVVVTSEGEKPMLYVDGVPAREKKVEREPEKFIFRKGKTSVSFAGSPRGCIDLKTDFLEVTDQPMSADEVKKHYEAGKPLPGISDISREILLDQIKMDIPKNSSGYFNVADMIPVTVSVPPELNADKVTVNGKDYKLSDKISLKFDRIGLEKINISVSSAGNDLRSITYPVAIIPPAKDFACYGANNIQRRTPASFALGVRMSHEVFHWSEIEPRKGEYNWEKVDRIMDWNKANGIETVFCLTGKAYWAKFPENLPQFKKIWSLILARYDLKYAEVWSAAPQTGSHMSDFAFYTELVKIVKDAAKEESPDTRILAGRNVYNFNGYHKSLKGKPELYDILSVAYLSKSTADQTLKNLVNNPEKKPVWITEGSMEQQADGLKASNWNPHEKLSAILSLKSLVFCKIAGAAEWFLSSGPDEYKPVSYFPDGNPGWKGLAMGVFNSFIGKDAVFSVAKAPASLTAIQYTNKDKSCGLILFSNRKDVNVSLPGRGMTLFGEPVPEGNALIGQTPVFLPGAANL